MTTKEEIENFKVLLQSIGRTLVEQKLTFGNAGNISVRLDQHYCLITARGSRLGDLKLHDLIEQPFSLDLPYASKASKEFPMHLAVYAVRPEINAIIHAAPLYSTLIACSDLEIPSGLFVETMYFLERVARVPYQHPGSMELAWAVREQATTANIMLLENHGVLVYDTDMPSALMGLQTLETACQMIITARSTGINLRVLSPEMVSDFLENAGYKPRRQWSS